MYMYCRLALFTRLRIEEFDASNASYAARRQHSRA